MESNEVIKIVAQSNETIFYIGWWFKIFEEEPFVEEFRSVGNKD